MNSEVLIKYKDKANFSHRRKEASYFVTQDLHVFPKIGMFFGSPVNGTIQDFKSTYRYKTRKQNLELINAVENAKKLGFDVPNDEVINLAYSTLENIERYYFSILFINPSSDGGIIIELNRAGIYYLIELFNDGDIVFLKRDGENREVFDLDKEGLFELIKK